MSGDGMENDWAYDGRAIAIVERLQTQLTESQKCSVCAGMGNPVSGLPCVCGGEGTVTAELHGLRALLFESRAREKELVEVLDNMTGDNLPTAYDGDDDVGHCPYCRGWNMRHSDRCEAMIAERLVAKHKEER